VLTPCDFPFARDGIAADTTPNAEMVSIADLQLDNLVDARQYGTVQNLRDRRFDLYSVNWVDKQPVPVRAAVGQPSASEAPEPPDPSPSEAAE
jgi:hypothetical protein